MAAFGRVGYRRPVRHRYIDLLRALAILRVIVYHVFGWAWLTVVLPAMGVMFALAGSLMAESLRTRGARRAVASRVRRLLPPLWALALVAVPVMLAAGWSVEDERNPLRWRTLVFWLIPLGDPPGSQQGQPLVEALWYLRAYLWFVLLSPLLYLAWRRAWWLTLALPFAMLIALMTVDPPLPSSMESQVWDFATYGGCWLAGFAHQEGRLARLPRPVMLGVAGGAATAGLVWLLFHPGRVFLDLNDVPLAQALWSLAFVLVVLRWRPELAWLERFRFPDAAVRVLNARAVTVYLWHDPMITVSGLLLSVLALDDTGPLDGPLTLTVTVLLVAIVLAALGWIEDLAAGRRPAVWPSARQRHGTVLSASVEPGPAGRGESTAPVKDHV